MKYRLFCQAVSKHTIVLVYVMLWWHLTPRSKRLFLWKLRKGPSPSRNTVLGDLEKNWISIASDKNKDEEKVKQVAPMTTAMMTYFLNILNNRHDNKWQQTWRECKSIRTGTEFYQVWRVVKATWKGIKDLINRNKKTSKQITSLKYPHSNRITHNISEFPDIFNKYFSSVGHKLASQIPNSQASFVEYLPNVNISSSFSFNPVSSSEIELEIKLIPTKKSYGLYSCPLYILKLARYMLSKPLSDLINKSVENGIYPSKLKHAKIIPIYKKGDETDPTNYSKMFCINLNTDFVRNTVLNTQS